MKNVISIFIFLCFALSGCVTVNHYHYDCKAPSDLIEKQRIQLLGLTNLNEARLSTVFADGYIDHMPLYGIQDPAGPLGTPGPVGLNIKQESIHSLIRSGTLIHGHNDSTDVTSFFIPTDVSTFFTIHGADDTNLMEQFKKTEYYTDVNKDWIRQLLKGEITTDEFVDLLEGKVALKQMELLNTIK